VLGNCGVIVVVFKVLLISNFKLSACLPDVFMCAIKTLEMVDAVVMCLSS